MKIEYNRKVYTSKKSISPFSCLKCVFKKGKCPTFKGRCLLAPEEHFIHTNLFQLFEL